MADHASHSHGQGGDIAAHRETYGSFVRGAVALVLLCIFICTALVMFRFAGSGNVLMGFGGLIVGILALIIDFRSGAANWPLSLGWAVIFGLITAVSVA
jgi:Bacterial aa3 type cytochrome c oxidase subunit IV